MIGTNELLIIALVVLVLFGASAIPKFAKSLGQAKKEFDKGVKEGGEGKDKDADKNADKNGDTSKDESKK